MGSFAGAAQNMLAWLGLNSKKLLERARIVIAATSSDAENLPRLLNKTFQASCFPTLKKVFSRFSTGSCLHAGQLHAGCAAVLHTLV